jgi:repressor LexA
MKATVQLDPNKKALTEKQHEFLLFLQNFVEEQGYPPTMKEMCAKMNLSSTNAANQYIQALERKGYIRRATKGASRGLQIIDFTPRPRHTAAQQQAYRHTQQHIATNGVPAALPPVVKNVIIAGNGTASKPLSGFLSPVGQIKIDLEFFCQDAETELFCAFVQEDGMSSDGIRQGDVVVARQQFDAEDGQLVVALFHDMTVIRRYTASLDELTASVRGFPAIPYFPNTPHVKIVGVVVGLMRVV